MASAGTCLQHRLLCNSDDGHAEAQFKRQTVPVKLYGQLTGPPMWQLIGLCLPHRKGTRAILSNLSSGAENCFSWGSAVINNRLLVFLITNVTLIIYNKQFMTHRHTQTLRKRVCLFTATVKCLVPDVRHVPLTYVLCFYMCLHNHKFGLGFRKQNYHSITL